MEIEKIKQIREETGAGVMDVKNALAESNGSVEAAIKTLKEKGLMKASKKEERETKSGLVYAYIHGNGEIGVLIEINCETSFVAKTDEFKQLAHELSLQIASMDPANIEELLAQDSIRDSKTKIEELVKSTIAKTGENITIGQFSRYQISA